MQPSSAGLQPRKFGALGHRDFTLFWSGLLISNSGTWMQTVAQGWLTYQLTNSPFYLGLLGASFALPMIVLPMVGGTIADRFERLTILKWTQSAMMLCAMALATVAFYRIITIEDIIATSFLSAVALAVDNPTRQALIPDLVPTSELLSAISLNSVAFNGAALLGPALAGAILGVAGHDLFLGCSIVFYLNAVSYLAVLVPVFFIRPRPLSRRRAPRHFSAEVFDGLRYVQQRPALLALLALSAIASLFGRSFSQLLPVFARDILHVGPEGLGLMLTVPGAGTLVAGFSLAGGGHHLNRRWLIVGALLTFAGSIIAFACSRSFPVALAFLGLNGFSATTFGAMIATILQLETEGELRGRVMSLYTVTIVGLGPLGSLLSGSISSIMPVTLGISVPAFIIILCLAYAVSRPAWQEVQ